MVAQTSNNELYKAARCSSEPQGTKFPLNSASDGDSCGSDDVEDTSSDEDLFSPVWVKRSKTSTCHPETEATVLQKLK